MTAHGHTKTLWVTYILAKEYRNLTHLGKIPFYTGMLKSQAFSPAAFLTGKQLTKLANTRDRKEAGEGGGNGNTAMRGSPLPYPTEPMTEVWVPRDTVPLPVSTSWKKKKIKP